MTGDYVVHAGAETVNLAPRPRAADQPGSLCQDPPRVATITGMNATFKACLFAATLTTAPALADSTARQGQPIEQRGYEPVESLVDDVDPSAESLRQLQSGNRQEGGQETFIYRERGAETNDRLYYIAPGVVAEFDRSEYRSVEVQRQQVLLHKIPANTTFHLGLPEKEPAAPPLRDSPFRLSLRIDGRRDRSQPAPDDAAEGEGAPRGAAAPDWAAYGRQYRTQQTAVLQAIDRLAPAASP